jgi:hypothetical protein
MSNIWVLKLITGEEIVTRGAFHKETDNWICERPYIFQVVPDYQGGNHRAALGPYFMTDRNADCDFKDSHVVSFIEAPQEMKTQYIRQTTGIEIAGVV